MQRASIGTVDAFCLHFVQQHFAMLDVPPDFETADEADLARIEQETLAATLETAYQDPDFRAFADLYDRGRTDNTAGDAILDLYHFTRALPHPAASLAAFAAMWQQDAPPKDTLWRKELLGIALARAQGAKTLLESGMTFRREGVPMGLPGLDEWHIQQTDADAVRAAKAAVMR